MIRLSERGKLGTQKQSNANEVLNGKVVKKNLNNITILYLGESGGIVPMKQE